MSLTQALDGFQRRHPAAGFPLAVFYKYFDDQGAYLAALMAYYGFLSLFPLLLLLTTALGILLRNDVELQQQVLQSAARQIPVLGNELVANPRSLPGGKGLVIGVVGALYGGIGVAQAAQNAMNVIWAVPRNSRPNPFKVRGRSLLLLVTVGVGLLATTVLSELGRQSVQGVGVPGLQVLVSLGAVAANVALFVFAFRLATARRLSRDDVLPGAVGAAVALQLLQLVGGSYVKRVINGGSATGSVFAAVLGLLAYLFLVGVIIVLCAEVNVVRALHLYPRALLTPFTDAVDLTPGDERAYARAAKAQRNKGFEKVDVSFDKGRTRGDEARDTSQD